MIDVVVTRKHSELEQLSRLVTKVGKDVLENIENSQRYCAKVGTDFETKRKDIATVLGSLIQFLYQSFYHKILSFQDTRSIVVG